MVQRRIESTYIGRWRIVHVGELCETTCDGGVNVVGIIERLGPGLCLLLLLLHSCSDCVDLRSRLIEESFVIFR